MPPSTAWHAWQRPWKVARPRPSATWRWPGEGATVSTPDQYCIRIRYHLDPSWSVWFSDLAIMRAADGTTTLTGPVVDQAELYGLLGRLRDLGATLLSVERLTD